MSSQASDSLEFCSMDYWDYFVELECLQNSKGKDLQLAAELGKTLLERNKELETGLKQQQTVIDDQSQEIEYLSKQSVALREVNDSRLRVYEQLEVSIQELEVTNQRLQDESTRDKKRIRSLTQSVECLELRAAELQALVEELRSAEQAYRAASAAAAAAAAGQHCREGGRRDSETKVPGGSEQLAEQVALLEHQLAEARGRERQERERRQWAETETATAQQECSELRQEMAALRERSVKLHTLAEEVHALEEHRLSPFMRRCSPRACSVSPQMAAESHCAETAAEHPPRSVWGEDAVRWPAGDSAPLPPEDPGSAPASLISDLDAHYRVLLDRMDKYEWRLTSRPARPATPDQPSSLSLLEELQMSVPPPPPPPPLRAEPLRDSGPASLMLIGCDGDASSSGFSEGSEGSRAVSRATQTPEVVQAVAAVPQKKVTAVFQHTPQYKQLFQEIFQMLKKPVALIPAVSDAVKECALATTDAEAEAVTGRAITPAEALERHETTITQEKASSCEEGEATSVSREVSLQATLPVEIPSEREIGSVSELSERSSRAANSRSRSASATRTFSYAEEYERRLRASTPAAADGASEAPPGVAASSAGEDFPVLVRPSEEVAKLRLLERSYAEALKAGRRCFYRPTLL